MIGKTNGKYTPETIDIVSWGGGYDTRDNRYVRCSL